MPLSEREQLDMLTTQRFRIGQLERTLKLTNQLMAVLMDELNELRKQVGVKGRKRDGQ